MHEEPSVNAKCAAGICIAGAQSRIENFAERRQGSGKTALHQSTVVLPNALPSQIAALEEAARQLIAKATAAFPC